MPQAFTLIDVKQRVSNNINLTFVKRKNEEQSVLHLFEQADKVGVICAKKDDTSSLKELC
jgi:hypothetical protein